jgi:hypothetical protein
MRGIIRGAMTGLEQLKDKRVTLCLTHFLIEQWLPFGKPTNSGGQKERERWRGSFQWSSVGRVTVAGSATTNTMSFLKPSWTYLLDSAVNALPAVNRIQCRASVRFAGARER